MSVKKGHRSGAALLIVLAFVVLMTAVAVAYLGRSTSDRQSAASSYGDAFADLLAKSAMNVVVGDFKQEIVDGSTVSTVGGVTVYTPSSNANVIPQRNIAGIPNLIRISVNADSLTSPAVKSPGSTINSTNNPSLNGRLIGTSRWNKHCLLPMRTPATADTDPEPVTTFSPPDWVYVTGQGPIAAPPPATVIGRYAYAVYDEGGLLDINVAGFPSPSPAPSPNAAGGPVGRKGIITFADMRALPYSVPVGSAMPAPGSTPPSEVSLTAIGQIVGWRNNATIQVTPSAGNFPSLANVTASGNNNFLSVYLSKNSVFTAPSASSTPVASTNYASDQIFLTRGELLNFYKTQKGNSSSVGIDSNTLGYLGTFSRDRNVPTFWLQTVPGASSITPLTQRFLMDKISNLIAGTSNTTDFGLQWQSTTGRWKYVNTITMPSSGTGDFFQLLHYARSTSSTTPSLSETLALGAAIIDQCDADSNTTQIEFDNGGTPGIAYGMETNDTARPAGSPTPAPTPPSTYKMWNGPLRNVAEMGYAFLSTSTGADKTVNFTSFTGANYDPRILDLFTYNKGASPWTSPPTGRAGLVNLNTQNEGVIAAIVRGAWRTATAPSASGTAWDSTITGGTGVAATNAASVANAIVTETKRLPALGRQDIARICAATGVGSGIGAATDEAKEAVARSLSEICTTRTWGLFIDVIAQSGHCKPNTSNLADFAVDGEKRYWLHVAIDRFSGDVIDQQLEAVLE